MRSGVFRGGSVSAASRIKRIFWFALIAAAIFFITVFAGRVLSGGDSNPQSIAIPAYFYPGAEWDRIAQAHPTVKMVIVNPASGPDDSFNEDFAEQVQKSKAAGLTVIGYSQTEWAERDVDLIKDEIDKYYEWYGVDGIFLDEANARCERVAYYEEVNDHIKSKTGERTTVLNPGLPPDECYMEVSDIIVTFEEDYESYVADYEPREWFGEYEPDRFWHLVHSAPDIENMEEAVSLGKRRGAGWIYVTPDVMTNPWDVLPPQEYWNREIEAVRSD